MTSREFTEIPKVLDVRQTLQQTTYHAWIQSFFHANDLNEDDIPGAKTEYSIIVKRDAATLH